MDILENIHPLVINLLEKQSIVSIIANEYFNDNSLFARLIPYDLYVISPYVFCMNLKVIINDTDKHINYITPDEGEIEDYFKDSFVKMTISFDADFVEKNSYKNYQADVMKLEKFIKIFKPELEYIDIDKKEDKDNYICRKMMNYGDYRVDSEFESTGIKKLITLYNAFSDLNNGKIVFIDELDANLHDVYLCKLIEYFSYYAKGQLCFTTHNLTPMEVLKKRNYSIDFLSDHCTITSWTKNGNYSVSKFYKEGMINGSPFNIESFDFLGIFDED